MIECSSIGPIESLPELKAINTIVAAEQHIATKKRLMLYSHQCLVKFRSGSRAMAPRIPRKGKMPAHIESSIMMNVFSLHENLHRRRVRHWHDDAMSIHSDASIYVKHEYDTRWYTHVYSNPHLEEPTTVRSHRVTMSYLHVLWNSRMAGWWMVLVEAV